MARVTVFQEIRPGAGFKTGEFRWRNVGGATEERLRYSFTLEECNLHRTIEGWLHSNEGQTRAAKYGDAHKYILRSIL